MIEAINLHKSFKDLEILKGVNLSIKEGEVLSIVGSSGAGKTTLLQVLGTLILPDSGSLNFDGKNVADFSQKKLADFRNKNIGFIFQFHHLLPEFTALENVFIPAIIGGLGKKEASQKAEYLLEKLGIAHRMSHKPSQLSGGEQQRVATARALINQPKIVLADEPSGNLDSKSAASLHQLFFDLRKELNQCFVIVTHNETLADQCDRKYQMIDGKLI